jgi:hypothetical protein
MDVIVFLAGYLAGVYGGVVVAALSWLIYGVLNPLGFSIFMLLAVIPAQTVYGLAGVLLSKTGVRGTFAHVAIRFGLAGLLSTLVYDVATNMVYGIVFTNTLWPGMLVGLLTMNFPLPLGIMHEVSNLLLFAFLAPKVIPMIRRATVPNSFLPERIKF